MYEVSNMIYLIRATKPGFFTSYQQIQHTLMQMSDSANGSNRLRMCVCEYVCVCVCVCERERETERVRENLNEKKKVLLKVYCNILGVLYSRWNFITLQKSIHYS
jgi:hypothetical protein